MNGLKYLMFLSVLMIGVGASAGEPIKVFILAGQSNMQGVGKISTIERLAQTPEGGELYKALMGGEGAYETTEVDIEGYKGRKYTVVPDTYISFKGAKTTGKNSEVKGPLTVGFGKHRDQVGVELAFGLTMQQKLKQPILIIKVAWGGRNLVKQFRPPSAGPCYTDEEAEKIAVSKTERNKKKGKDVVVTAEELKAQIGREYRDMVAHVNHVLANIEQYHPAYSKEDGYEIAGFVWFQGWNDLVNGSQYPENKEHPEKRYALYTDLLTTFIHDVRKELKAPKMPFVIGVIGVGGELALDHKQQYFRAAQAAPAALPEFEGTVKAVYTHKYWDTKAQSLFDKVAVAAEKRVDEEHPELKNKRRARGHALYRLRKSMKSEVLTEEELAFLKQSTSNAGFHYLGSAYTYSLIGKAFAEAMEEMVSANAD